MKIFIQNDNYISDQGFYMVPDTALNQVGRPLFLPDFALDALAAPHAVIRIDRLGKHIAERFAHRYYRQMTVGVCFRAEGFLQSLHKKGFPTEPATGFDGAANLGKWVNVAENCSVNSTEIVCKKNGQTVCHFHTKDMLQKAEAQIAALSQYYKLCQGDLLFLGSPSKIKTNINDCFTATINDQEVMYFYVK